MGVSKYQLVKYGWGAMLPATLYPAIYYVAVGHILAGTIKTINRITTNPRRIVFSRLLTEL
jgi:hypothetical protein